MFPGNEREAHTGSYRDVMTHKMMLEDAIRTSAYAEAIARVVTPETRVIDFGSGTGVLAIFAARNGAAAVHAIERTAMVHRAREIAMRSGHPDILFHGGDESTFEMEGQADIIVSEWMGHFVFHEAMLEPLIRLRNKWLKPGGIMVPSAVSLHAALVTDREVFERDSFLEGSPYGIDFSPIADLPRRQSRLIDFDADQVLDSYCHLGTLDMGTLNCAPDVLTGSLRPSRTATTYGLVGWFECELVPGSELGTGPHQPQTHWRQIYFPFVEPLEVSPERPLNVKLRPPREHDVPEPGWAWSISDGVTTRATDERTTFMHCGAQPAQTSND